MKRLMIFAVLLAGILQANAQSRDFSFGKGVETQYSVLKEVAASYVDTIDYHKMLTTGIQAMLSTLDPYTVYIPEEEEEDFHQEDSEEDSEEDFHQCHQEDSEVECQCHQEVSEEVCLEEDLVKEK